MFASLLILLGVLLLVVVFIAVGICLDVARHADGILDKREQDARSWRPPFVRGRDLLDWARDTTSRIVGKQLAKAPDAAAPGKLAAELHEGATRAMLPLAEERDSHRPVTCPAEGQGMIAVTVPEVLEIADYIQQNLPRAERRRIHDLAVENARRLAGVDHTHFNGVVTPCPLQGTDRVCCTFASRPLRCRPLHAMAIAKELGLDFSTDGQDPLKGLPHEQAVEQGVEQGFTSALASAGLDGHLYELNSALVTALETPDVARRWMQGEDVFAGCQHYH